MTIKRSLKMSRRTLIASARQPLVMAALSSAALLAAERNEKQDDTEDSVATAEDYAAIQFDALEVDLKKIRAAYENMWMPLAISMKLLCKSPDECREVIAQIGDNMETFDATIETLSQSVAWYRTTADAIDGALVRFLAGAARQAKIRI